MESIRRERNLLPDGILRTPFPLTPELQEQWYHDEICNRNSRTRYWGLWDDHHFVGYGGIENIQWESSIGEMSLLVFQDYRKMGFGGQAVKQFLDRAFNHLNLHTVFAEVYESNPNIAFWDKQAKTYKAHVAVLPRRKYCNGTYYSSRIYTYTGGIDA